jgi:hypothetical protein
VAIEQQRAGGLAGHRRAGEPRDEVEREIAEAARTTSSVTASPRVGDAVGDEDRDLAWRGERARAARAPPALARSTG